MNEIIANFNKIHCIGIGGIGISALARLFHDYGKEVTGSDREETELFHALQEEGIECHVGHERSHITEDVDLIVYSPAISNDNPALEAAKDMEIPTMSYPEVLGHISENMFTIAVAGTHGKTTTTAMIADILIDADLSPTVIIGSILKNYNSNYISGNGSIFIVEACEFKRSFTNIKPDIAVITNIEEDHMDYYKDLDDVKSAYKEFISHIKPGGVVVANICHEAVGDIVQDIVSEVDDYSIISVDEEVTLFGNHNYENAKAALAVAKRLNISDDTANKALNNFKGTWRRLEERGTLENGAVWIDDYAHHPTEITTTLDAIKSAYPNHILHVLFQPHLYSRTKHFLQEFGRALVSPDYVYLLPIYEARAEALETISHEDVSNEINTQGGHAIACNSFSDCREKVLFSSNKNSIVVTMGAGDVYQIFEHDSEHHKKEPSAI